ncbi:MAG: DUF4405 domain-containing protein [Candidatus Altiarchaeota archaeon]|nr:DUF4405 domain-containing protein [Candidatus Altiarchaeota archaeon]
MRYSYVFSALLCLAFIAYADVDCPFGVVDDPYPGQCARYTDKDGNSICDLSQSQEAYIAPSVDEVKTAKMAVGGKYNLVEWILFLSLSYLGTLILSKRERITCLTHRRVWNVALLIAFLVSAVLGVLLVVRINYGIVFPQWINILYWHVEAGIAMAVISVFHILWHWQYFVCIVKRPKPVGKPKGRLK